MARLPDPTDTLTDTDREIYERMLAARKSRGTGIYGPYTALLNHPKLAGRIEQLGYYLKFESELPRDVYQFVVLTFAKRVGVEFEWVDHIGPARKAGLTEEIIAALESGSGEIPERYATVGRCMDIVMSYQSIPDTMQSRIVELYGIKGLIEIVVLCGFYSIIGMVNMSFDVPLTARPDDK
jgi:4-carboxymuconolactone decarboxylase